MHNNSVLHKGLRVCCAASQVYNTVLGIMVCFIKNPVVSVCVCVALRVRCTFLGIMVCFIKNPVVSVCVCVALRVRCTFLGIMVCFIKNPVVSVCVCCAASQVYIPGVVHICVCVFCSHYLGESGVPGEVSQ